VETGGGSFQKGTAAPVGLRGGCMFFYGNLYVGKRKLRLYVIKARGKGRKAQKCRGQGDLRWTFWKRIGRREERSQLAIDCLRKGGDKGQEGKCKREGDETLPVSVIDQWHGIRGLEPKGERKVKLVITHRRLKTGTKERKGEKERCKGKKEAREKRVEIGAPTHS